MNQNIIKINVTDYPKIQEFFSKPEELKIGDFIDDNDFQAVYCGDNKFNIIVSADVLLKEHIEHLTKLLEDKPEGDSEDDSEDESRSKSLEVSSFSLQIQENDIDFKKIFENIDNYIMENQDSFFGSK